MGLLFLEERLRVGREFHGQARSLGLRYVALVASCVLLSGALGCGANDSSKAEDKPPAPLDVNVIQIEEHDDVYERKLYYGTVKPRRSSNLGFARGGRVGAVLVNVGDTVNRDEAIVVLEQSQLEEELASLTDAIDRTEQELGESEGSSNALRQQQIGDLQRKLADLQRQRSEVVSAIADGKIVAPYDCVIAERMVSEGDTVPMGRPVVKVDELGPPIIEVDVAAAIADRIQKGQRAWVYKDDSPMAAFVESKSPEVNAASRTQTIYLSVASDDEDTRWKFGELVEIRSWTRTDQAGFWLPYSALQREAGGLWSAYIIAEEDQRQVVARRTVELLQIGERTVLARGSLREGDRLILDGLNRVVPGQRVNGKLVVRDFQIPGPPGAEE
jgi:RND family efflux transporter MFP subunit